jgi:hypothetical protein
MLASANFFLSSLDIVPSGLPSLALDTFIVVSQSATLTCYLLKCTTVNLSSLASEN